MQSRKSEFRDYIQGYEQRARQPHRETSVKLLFVIKALLMEKLVRVIDMQRTSLGVPFCGVQDDVWSKALCRQSFACMRVSLILDGEQLDSLFGLVGQFAGQVLDVAPILAFTTLPTSRHSGRILARWKVEIFTSANMTVCHPTAHAHISSCHTHWECHRWLMWHLLPRMEPATIRRAITFSASPRKSAATTICIARLCAPRTYQHPFMYTVSSQ